jgi:hypothetical protein
MSHHLPNPLLPPLVVPLHRPRLPSQHILSFLMHLTARPTLLENLDKQIHGHLTPLLWSPLKWHELPIHMITYVD